ncbi:hypothetical protein G7074_20295 [Pedobacter sp. HDW13]|nr:hypothetical protein G7074_20295 [Pedobacter sp. HDW13]
MEFALTNRKQLTEDLLKADILSGYTGNLLLFTLLYHHTGHVGILSMVSSLIDRAVTEARISAQGLKWDYSRAKKAYDSMTGFSHGASGIAWVLMQVGKYFDAAGLVYLAEEALKYEMQYYHQPDNNWLDLRLGPHRLNKPNAHEWNLQTFLPEMTDVNAWAHGAAGIGLTRRMAFEFTDKQNYQVDCKNILKRCLNDIRKLDRDDFTLVSGYTGMIPFLLTGKIGCGVSIETEVIFILEQAAKLHKRTNSYNAYVSCGAEDYGLLSGKTGIGYIIIRLLKYNKQIDILNPELPVRCSNKNFRQAYSVYNIKKTIFSRYYKRTLGELKEVSPSVFEANNIDEFQINLKAEILNNNSTGAKTQYELECAVANLWKLHKGYFSFDQKHKHLRKMADESLSITDKDLVEHCFQLSSHVKIYNLDQKEGNELLLLVSDENGVSETNIGVFPAMILSAVDERGMRGLELINQIQSVFFKDIATETLLAELQVKVVQQLRLLIKAGFIVLRRD